MKLKVAFCIALLFLISAGEGLAQPRPAESKYLITEGAGFITGGEGGVMYAVDFSVRERLPGTVYAQIVFENPQDRKAPFIVDVVIEAGEDLISAESPAIKRIKNGKRYRVEVVLYSDEAHDEEIGRHVQKIEFSLPEGMEEMFGVELL